MHTVKTTLGILLAALLVAVAMVLQGGLGAFFDGLTLLFVCGVSLCVTLGMHGPLALRTALAAGLRGTAQDDQLVAHAAVLGTLRHTLLAAGAVGMLIGLVLLLMQLDDPDHLGPAVAVALLSLFYGGGLAECVVAPLEARLAAAAAASGASFSPAPEAEAEAEAEADATADA